MTTVKYLKTENNVFYFYSNDKGIEYHFIPICNDYFLSWRMEQAINNRKILYIITEDEYEKDIKNTNLLNSWKFNLIGKFDLVSFYDKSKLKYQAFYKCPKNKFVGYLCIREFHHCYLKSKEQLAFNYREGIDYLEEITKHGYISAKRI